MADWDSASEVIYNPEHPSWTNKPEHIMFVHDVFTPSALAYSLQAYGRKVCSLQSYLPWAIGCVHYKT